MTESEAEDFAQRYGYEPWEEDECGVGLKAPSYATFCDWCHRKGFGFNDFQEISHRLSYYASTELGIIGLARVDR